MIKNEFDAYSPAEIAVRIEKMGVFKAGSSTVSLFFLSLLAGAFISIGGIFYITVMSDSSLGFGLTRWIGGICFSTGLIMVVAAGAELFTGNNLLAMAWASKKISTGQLLRNWLITYLGNAMGCLITVIILLLADIGSLNHGKVGEAAVSIASLKSELPLTVVFMRGILCNALVCIAVWLAMGGHSITDKILAIIFPISAFVTLGLEHSIANWFFLPFGYALNSGNSIQIQDIVMCIIASTLGNIIGGTILVSGIYWIAYIRNSKI